MALQGHVKTISLLEIFQFLSAKHTGTLTIQARGQRRVVFFVDGAIHVPRHQALTVGRIGDFLVKQGLVSVDKVYSALEEQKANGGLLGEILLERGDVTPEQLEAALRLQYEEEIYQVFIWDDATFTFEKDVVPEDAQDSAKCIVLKADGLLMEAARRMDEWGRLIASIPSLRTIYVMRAGSAPAIEGLANEKHVNFDPELINGRRSVQDLFAVAREGQFQLAEFLYSLIEAGHIFPLEGGSVPDEFRQALKTGSFDFAVALILHGYESEDIDRSIIRELEATLLKTRAFIRDTQVQTIPLLREGPSLIEFVLAIIKNMMSGLLVARAAARETRIWFDRQKLRLSSPDRDLLGLEEFLAADKRISPIDVKKIVMQVQGGQADVAELLEASGVVDTRDWHRHVMARFQDELFEMALTPGIDAIFEKNQVTEEARPDHRTIELHIHQENVFFEVTETISRWLERSEILPILDMVLIESDYGNVDSPVKSYVNGKTSVRDILERSKLHPVKTYEALVDLVDTGAARPLDVSEMMDTVQYMLGADRAEDALRLCRAAQRCDLDADTFAEVEGAILEEHGDITASEKEYRLSGDARDFSLAEVLQSLSKHGKSGTLKITDGTDERDIHFEKGQVWYLRMEDAEKASFGSQFLDFDLQDMTEGLFGDDQVPTGEVEEEDAPEAFVEQLKEEIFDTFIWDNASFIFTANFFPPEYHAPSDTTTKLRLSTDRFLMQAVSIIEEWEAVQDAFSMKTIFKFVSSEAKMEAVKDLGKPEVLYLIDGRLNVKSIVRRSGFDKLTVCNLLYDLLQSEWIEQLSVDELLAAATVAIEKNDDAGALTYLAYALELDPANDEVREAIEQISGQPPE